MWTEQDRLFLETHYGQKSPQAIADHIGVTKGSVYSHAFAYGLSQSHAARRNLARYVKQTEWKASLLDIMDTAMKLDADPYTDVDVRQNRRGEMAVYARPAQKRAFLLAAGLGTRLRPLTDTVPKCLLPINGHTMLYYWFQLLMQHNVGHVLVNTHHLAPMVRDYVDGFLAGDPGLAVGLSHEKELRGTAGTVKSHRHYIDNEREFLILYADNLTTVNLAELLRFHRSKDTLLTMGVFKSNAPSECGIVQMEHDGMIVDFAEKPRTPKGNLANAGIYVASPEIVDFIPDGFADFGKDVLPKLAGKMYGYRLKGYLRDIGTFEGYQAAQTEWRNRHG